MQRVIDLSMVLYEGMPKYPHDGVVPFKVRATAKVETDGMELTEIIMSSHAGTHFDTPHHALSEGKTIEAMDLNRMVGKAVVFNVSHLSRLAPISRDELQKCGVQLSKGDAALIYTGVEKLLGKPEYFSDYSPLTADAADWLVQQGVGIVGVDMTSADHDFSAHLVLFRAGVCIVESLVNLEALLTGGPYLFVALPLPIPDVEASPVRAVAIQLGDDDGATGNQAIHDAEKSEGQEQGKKRLSMLCDCWEKKK
jgi:kynurenine formamidase